MPTRGSFSSRMSSATSRWIWSATRKLRLGIWCLCFIGVDHQEQTPPASSQAGFGDGARAALQRSSHFLDLEDFQLVAFLDLVVVLQLDAALEAFLDFAHVVLQAANRFDLAGVDDDVVAQQAEACAAAHQARRDHRA